MQTICRQTQKSVVGLRKPGQSKQDTTGYEERLAPGARSAADYLVPAYGHGHGLEFREG